MLAFNCAAIVFPFPVCNANGTARRNQKCPRLSNSHLLHSQAKLPLRRPIAQIQAREGTSCPKPVPRDRTPAGTAIRIAVLTGRGDSAPASSLTMSDSSAHPALLTSQFSAAFPRFLHTHAETPTPSLRLFDKLVWK